MYYIGNRGSLPGALALMHGGAALGGNVSIGSEPVGLPLFLLRPQAFSIGCTWCWYVLLILE